MSLTLNWVTGTETVGTGEWSLTTDTAGPDVETTVGEFQFWLDTSALQAADIFEFKIYEKVRSGDTQRVVFSQTLTVDNAPNYVTPFWLALGNGWDATLVKLSGTDRAILWRISRKDDGADMVAISGDTVAADALETFLDGTGGNVFTAKQFNINNPDGHAFVAVSTKANSDGIHAVGGNALGGTPAGHGMSLSGGTASTTTGGSAGAGASVTGGTGAASTNGAGTGWYTVGGGNTTVSGGWGWAIAGTGNRDGMYAQGAGSGHGGKWVGGATGHGGHFFGGATSGHGLLCEADTDGNGLYALGLSSGDGIAAEGWQGITGTAVGGPAGQDGAGMQLAGKFGGAGLQCDAGVTGNGIAAGAGASGNGHGVIATGVGTGSGGQFTAGTSGHGVQASGGATAGYGFNPVSLATDWAAIGAEGNDGPAIAGYVYNGNHNALELAANGTGAGGRLTGGVNGPGAIIEAGGGNNDGATFTKAGSGIDINATLKQLSTAGNNAVADQVWEEAIADHSGTVGSTAAALASAGSAGDPWATALPGAYTAGQAGKIVGDNLNATVSSRSSHSAADVWAVGTRLLTAGTNIVLAKGTGVTGFNDLSAAQVNAEAEAALADVGVTTTVTGRIDVAVSSRLAASSYTAPLDAAGTRAAVGLASANLDTQLGDLPTNAELATALAAADDATLAAVAAVQSDVTDVKTKTDRLTFNVRDEVAANTESVNDVALQGNGTSGNPWRPV